MDYKNAGVDIEAGYKSVELMKEHIKKTMRPEKFSPISVDFPVRFPWMHSKIWRSQLWYQGQTALEPS